MDSRNDGLPDDEVGGGVNLTPGTRSATAAVLDEAGLDSKQQQAELLGKSDVRGGIAARISDDALREKIRRDPSAASAPYLVNVPVRYRPETHEASVQAPSPSNPRSVNSAAKRTYRRRMEKEEQAENLLSRAEDAAHETESQRDDDYIERLGENVREIVYDGSQVEVPGDYGHWRDHIEHDDNEMQIGG